MNIKENYSLTFSVNCIICVLIVSVSGAAVLVVRRKQAGNSNI